MMRRPAVILAFLGLLGAASLLLVPLETLGPSPISPLELRALAALQAGIMTLVAVAIGAWAAPRVGLRPPVIEALGNKEGWRKNLRRQLLASVTAGIVVGVGLIGIGQANLLPDTPLSRFELPLPTRILYGGIVEELLMRWGLMSLLVWIAVRMSGKAGSPPDWTYWTGAAFAALIFAAGHLPILFVLFPNPPIAIVVAIIVGNFLPGLLFGWLYWRKGLEAAMIAHALAHLVAWAPSLFAQAT